MKSNSRSNVMAASDTGLWAAKKQKLYASEVLRWPNATWHCSYLIWSWTLAATTTFSESAGMKVTEVCTYVLLLILILRDTADTEHTCRTHTVSQQKQERQEGCPGNRGIMQDSRGLLGQGTDGILFPLVQVLEMRVYRVQLFCMCVPKQGTTL